MKINFQTGSYERITTSMKNNIFTIMKKECLRLFSDKRLLFIAVLMPGFLIFFVYSLMGNLMSNVNNIPTDYKYKINVVNMPHLIETLLTASKNPFEIIPVNEGDVEAVKTKLVDKETDILIKFPENFDAVVSEYNVGMGAAPNIQIWSNMARIESETADGIIKELLTSYESSLVNKFDINAPGDGYLSEDYNLATDADMFASYIVFMLPMMLILFMFVGCQSIAPESIAGEKERGTLGTILATPVKRSDIAFAKILSIAVFGVLSAVGSFAGLMLSLPRLMQIKNGGTLDFYSASDYVLILIISVSTVLVFVGILSILSTYAKSIKEATSYTMPLMILSMICGFSGMIIGGAAKEFYFYLIPVFNSAQCITAIFKFEFLPVNFAVTIASNFVFMLLCAWFLSKMFNSEKIVFDK